MRIVPKKANIFFLLHNCVSGYIYVLWHNESNNDQLINSSHLHAFLEISVHERLIQASNTI